MQYADFAVWQRALAAGRGAGARSSPTGGGSSPGAAAAAGAAHRPAAAGGAELPRRRRGRCALPAELVRQRSQALGRREGATLFMMLLAGFQAAAGALSAARTTSRSARPIAGRNRAEIEGLIGFFVNTLVLRGDLSGEPTLPRAARPGARDRAGRLRAPGPAVREAGRGAGAGARASRHAPLFQVMFVAAERSRREPGDPRTCACGR